VFVCRHDPRCGRADQWALFGRQSALCHGGKGGGPITFRKPPESFLSSLIFPIVPDAAQIESLALALAADDIIAISAHAGWLAP
jgi:hypothetical protein